MIIFKTFSGEWCSKVPESCPKVALKSETKMLGMKWRIWEAKILLLMRIRNHETNTLCRKRSMKKEKVEGGQD